jgi:hypothetical protein
VPASPRARVAILLATVVACAALLVGLAAVGPSDDTPPGSSAQLAPGRGAEPQGDGIDPLAWTQARSADFGERAAQGFQHVLYAKSPGGALATAQRVGSVREQVDRVAGRHGLDAERLEALVFLESGGLPDAQASDDLEGAAGLTQILAETGQNLLDMQVDVAASERLTRGIRRGRRVREREAQRRRVDERFDPVKALEATGRYLAFARRELGGREDLAFVAYHMGVGNLQDVLAAWGDEEPSSYAELFFDSTPLRRAAAWRRLAALGDDSATYLWRLDAARAIMAAWRHSPTEVADLQLLHDRKASAEEVLLPPGSTPRFRTPDDVRGALDDGQLIALDGAALAAQGLTLDPGMGELADDPAPYRALRPEALAVLRYLGAGVREITGRGTLRVTSTARDERYQRALLRSGNVEATRGYSLHTTGWAFDIAREYTSRKQAQAFQFWLDRLQALDVIAWVREPAAIHVTVGRRARTLVRPVLGSP